MTVFGVAAVHTKRWAHMQILLQHLQDDAAHAAASFWSNGVRPVIRALSQAQPYEMSL